MIIKIEENNSVVILKHILPEDEDLFLKTNSYTSSFKKISSLPDSPYSNYLWNGSEVVVNEEADKIQIQKLLNDQSRKFLDSTDWKVIRELEKLYLADTELHAERQAIRDSITD